jgi:hypothetical protein
VFSNTITISSVEPGGYQGLLRYKYLIVSRDRHHVQCSAAQTVCVPLRTTDSQIDAVPQLRGQVASLFLSSKRNRLYWALRYDTSFLPLKQLRTAAPWAWHRQPWCHSAMVGAEGVRSTFSRLLSSAPSKFSLACGLRNRYQRKNENAAYRSCLCVYLYSAESE